MRQDMMGFGLMAVASAGPYANNLHLAPDRQPLTPNQEYQSNEGTKITNEKPINPLHIQTLH